MKIQECCANCEYWKQFPPYQMLPMLEGECTKIEGKKRLFGKIKVARTKHSNYCIEFLLRNKQAPIV